MKTNVHFEWIDFYMELADKLLLYKNDRKRLIKKVKSVYRAINMRLPKLEKDNILVDIDPFTIFGLFNKGITNANRISVLRGFAQEFHVKAAVPEAFDGIPVLNNMSATFYRFIGERRENDINNLWKLFEYALEYAETHLDYSKRAFIEAYNLATKQKSIKWNLTMALYWIRPYEYINLDSRNRWYICNPENMPADYIESIGALGSVPTGAEYLDIVEKSRTALKNGNYDYKSFPELSYFAWVVSEQINEENRALMVESSSADADDTIGDNDIDAVHYTANDFLNEVYMSKKDYDILSYLLINKKNIILQGAPGVGKTFAAKRLAYSLMGVKDQNKVMMVQFHQSYSYEDFIMGFRPASTGFELKTGPFYSFCKKAELDPENDYYFIIDEINRGNLSKIFGELFMLIENDKRGQSLQLLYSDESFSVPNNLYIIGMMNTADRSLAMLDYALRRRFAFFELSPAFETDGFRRYRQKKNNKKFDRLIATVEKLNTAIENDETLGKGFRIGHSFFCTDTEIDDIWLNVVITHEIVPLLNEYWFDEVSKVRDWENALHEAIR